VQVGATSFTLKSSNVDWQGFGYLYRDRRGEAAVVDNTPSFDRPVDVTIATIGASYARVLPRQSGEFDLVGWMAAQAGDWYGRSHRAASVALEAGHRWRHAPLQPWLRGGYLWASGDRNQEDDRHGTFFQMMPSSRKYALSSVYAQMNLSDAFAQLVVEPRGLEARIEVHALRLASGQDLWYQGSGATASNGRYFGFSGRPAGGARSLGTVVEGTVAVPIKTYWSISGYAAMMSAGDAVTQMFTNKRLTFWSVENVIRF
jgi:Alginate export